MCHKQKGFTIIEVLLFLAVSGALFAMGVIGMNGQIQRTRFKQNMESIQFNISSVLDSVDKGYTLSDGNKTCRMNGANPEIIENSSTQTGVSSSNCLFYGRDINICSSANGLIVSTYLADNRIVNQPTGYPPKAVSSLQDSIELPSGIVFIPTVTGIPNPTDTTKGCHVASLYKSNNENYQKVPRFQANAVTTPNTNPSWSLIDDRNPTKWCFADDTGLLPIGSPLKASITISQTNVALQIGDTQCS